MTDSPFAATQVESLPATQAATEPAAQSATRDRSSAVDCLDQVQRALVQHVRVPTQIKDYPGNGQKGLDKMALLAHKGILHELYKIRPNLSFNKNLMKAGLRNAIQKDWQFNDGDSADFVKKGQERLSAMCRHLAQALVKPTPPPWAKAIAMGAASIDEILRRGKSSDALPQPRTPDPPQVQPLLDLVDDAQPRTPDPPADASHEQVPMQVDNGSAVADGADLAGDTLAPIDTAGVDLDGEPHAPIFQDKVEDEDGNVFYVGLDSYRSMPWKYDLLGTSYIDAVAWDFPQAEKGDDMNYMLCRWESGDSYTCNHMTIKKFLQLYGPEVSIPVEAVFPCNRCLMKSLMILCYAMFYVLCYAF